MPRPKTVPTPELPGIEPKVTISDAIYIVEQQLEQLAELQNRLLRAKAALMDRIEETGFTVEVTGSLRFSTDFTLTLRL